MTSKPVLAMVAAATLALSGTAAAQAAPGDSCTRGDAQKTIQAGIVGANHVRLGRTNTGLAEAIGQCRYGLYADGATYTFSEDDVFVGMTAFQWWNWEEEEGVTREEVNRVINGVEYTVLLAEVADDGSLGPFTELDVVRTPVKYHVMHDQGMTAYQVAGVILDLDAGTYVTQSLWSSPDYPGEDFTGTVTLVVTPD